MRATGIVRRIDELGRVVIPREIRRNLDIREGDPFEIYTEADGSVIFKKYSFFGHIENYAKNASDSLYACGIRAAIFDSYGDFVSGARALMSCKEKIIKNQNERRVLELPDEDNLACQPIFSEDSIAGYIIFERECKGKSNTPIVDAIAKMLGYALSC